MTKRTSRTLHFSVKILRKLPPNLKSAKSSDQEYSDSAVPGLKLFVSKNGRKSYHFRYVIGVIGKKTKRVIKITDFECLPLSEVRDIARKYRGMVSQNIDPLAERDKVCFVPDFKTFANKYLEWARVHKRSWKDDENKLNADLIPTFGNKPLSAITTKEIQDYLLMVKQRTTGGSSTSNRHRSLISKMFSLAIQWSATDCPHPCSKNKVPKFSEGSGRERYLSSLEIKRFITVLDEYKGNVTALLLKFLLYTGLRLGETRKLKWSDRTAPDQMHIIASHAKNKRGRHVQINSLAQSVLKELEDIRIVGNPYVFPGKKPATHLVNPNRLFRTVKSKSFLTDCTIHSLRHTFASISVLSGNDLYTVQNQLGHSSYLTTQKYAHISRGVMSSAGEKVAKEIGIAIGG